MNNVCACVQCNDGMCGVWWRVRVAYMWCVCGGGA